MYKKKFQPNILSILQSAGSKPLEMWTIKAKDGCVRKVLDDSIKLSVIEIISNNTSDTYISTAPTNYKTLGITLPILVLIVKNVDKYFSFRITIMDNANIRRSFRISNFQTVTRLSDKWCTIPLVLNEGWNIIQIDLNSYTEKAFKTKYAETEEIQINASIRIRCAYFCDRIYQDHELKDEFKIFSKKKEKIKYVPKKNVKKDFKSIVKKKKKETMQAEENAAKEKEEEKKQTEEKKGKKENEEVTEEEKEEIAENENEENDSLEKRETLEQEENYNEQVKEGEGEEEEEEEENEEENEEPENQLLNHSTIKNINIDMENVLYEDVNYDKYNNDDDEA